MADKVHGRPRGGFQVVIIGGGIAGQALALFLDIYNIFVNILNLLLIFSGQRD